MFQNNPWPQVEGEVIANWSLEMAGPVSLSRSRNNVTPPGVGEKWSLSRDRLQHAPWNSVASEMMSKVTTNLRNNVKHVCIHTQLYTHTHTNTHTNTHKHTPFFFPFGILLQCMSTLGNYLTENWFICRVTWAAIIIGCFHNPECSRTQFFKGLDIFFNQWHFFSF